jgi:MFS family permease
MNNNLPSVPGFSRRYYGWTLVAGLGMTTVIAYGTTLYLFGLLVVPIQSELGWSRGAISGAFTLGVVVQGVLGIPVGRLVDRHGARFLLSLGSVVGVISLLGLSQVRELWQLYFVWGVGLGPAMALTQYPVTFTVISNWFVVRRGTAMAVFTLLGGLASPIFIPISGLLISSLGWRQSVMVLAIVHLAVALPIHALLVRRHPEDHDLLPDGVTSSDSEESSRETGLTVRSALGARAFWTLSISMTLALFASLVIHAHQVAYVIERGFSPLFAANIAGLVGFASLPGRYVINRLSDQLDPQRLLALCSVIAAAGILLLSVADTRALLFGYVFLFGATWGAMPALRASTNAEHFGRRAYGSITSVQQVPATIAAAFGPLAAGYLHDALGNYALVLWLDAALWLLAGILVWLTPPPKATRDELVSGQSELAAAGVEP